MHLFDLVLESGPAYLPKRISIVFPEFSDDGFTQATVGRFKPECDVYLDERMVFCSKRHAQFKAQRPEEAPRRRTKGKKRKQDDKTGDVSIELKDLGSSNGTFVNRVKIEETAVKHNDEIIFGGSRLTRVGDSLPDDVLDAEEIVRWRVDCEPTAFTERGAEVALDDALAMDTTERYRKTYDATLLREENLELNIPEAPSVMKPARAPVTTMLDLSDSQSPKRKRAEDSTTKKPDRVTERNRQSFLTSTLVVPFDTAAVMQRGSATIGEVLASSRSPSAVAPVGMPDPVMLHSVRVGSATCAFSREPAAIGLSKAAATKQVTSALTFTETHWKWKMADPNGNTKNMVQMLLPITIIGSIATSRSDGLIVVFVKDGCMLPVVRRDVFEANRSISFVVDNADAVARRVDRYYSSLGVPTSTTLTASDCVDLLP